MKIRIGILGCSSLAIDKVLPSVCRENPHYEICALASRDRQKAVSTATKHAIPEIFSDYESLISSNSVDALYISLPNSHHYLWAKKALEHDKHVLVEKPAFLNASEATDTCSFAKIQNILVQEGFMYRYHPQHEYVREQIKNGLIGDVRLISTSFSYTLLSRHSESRQKVETAGGCLNDAGCYCIDFINTFFEDKPLRVNTFSIQEQNLKVETSLTATLEYPENRIAVIECSFFRARSSVCRLVGSSGTIVVMQSFTPGNETEIIHIDNNGNCMKVSFSHENIFFTEFTEFSKNILKKDTHQKHYDKICMNASLLETVRNQMTR